MKTSVLDELEETAACFINNITNATKNYNNPLLKSFLTGEITSMQKEDKKYLHDEKPAKIPAKSSKDSKKLKQGSNSIDCEKLHPNHILVAEVSENTRISRKTCNRETPPSDTGEKLTQTSRANKKKKNKKSPPIKEEAMKKIQLTATKEDQVNQVGKVRGRKKELKIEQRNNEIIPTVVASKKSKSALENIGDKLNKHLSVKHKATGASNAKRKSKIKQNTLDFKVDCRLPAGDGILDVKDYVKFLEERFKVNGCVKNLNDHVTIKTLDDNVTITAYDYKYSKRYLKYLTKKYFKKRGLRDWLRVVSTSPSVYQLRYYPVYCQHDDETDDDSE
ncbi:60S ribosomal protein L22-like [Hyalella azteca]|uniref:Large ribosomal subunit protein eL22 n=1 Tax=Hyalella azteca TaxID=294128 RepID=A0A8B7MY78_HYAAZ|nr:60S ribosomal protein L22-like [Hyalella azteca]